MKEYYPPPFSIRKIVKNILPYGFIKQYSGLETTIEYIYDLQYEISAEYIEVLMSRKV